MTMTFSLDEIRRISLLWIHWKLAPQKMSLLISQNGFNFEKIKDFDLSSEKFQFPQLIQFDTPVYFKFAKIEMTQPKKFYTFGI